MSNAMKKLKLLHHITAATTHSHPLPAQPSSAHHTFPTPPASPSYHHHRFPHFRPQPPPPPPKCQLPAGFMVLTPTATTETTNLQGLCVPASPPMAIPQQPPTTQTSIYSSRPPLSQHYQRRNKLPPRLTTDAIAKIGKDSRLARWERVLGYVREQRKNTLPSACTPGLKTIDENTPTSPRSWKHSVQERKRRAEELEAIEVKNRMLDLIDREEMDSRSLWSGGSAGTNGVDEFVWSEDEDDDVLPMPQAPPPVKVIPEEGLFEMEETKPSGGMLGWGQRIVEEMPMLCREAELEGGLSRLVGRRMSAAY